MNIKEKIKLLEEESSNLQIDNGQTYYPKKEGSLGLIALGYKGIIAWKKTWGKENK